jgi:hypothetical protein
VKNIEVYADLTEYSLLDKTSKTIMLVLVVCLTLAFMHLRTLTEKREHRANGVSFLLREYYAIISSLDIMKLEKLPVALFGVALFKL